MGLEGLAMDLTSCVHYAGQPITGTIILRINKPMKVNKIVVRCRGTGKAAWKTSGIFWKVKYKASVEYAKLKVTILGNPNDATKIPAGQHVFPFELLLPNELPSSHEDDTGCVKYILTAEVHRPWNTTNVFDKKRITVSSVYDLNLHASGLLTLPMSCQKAKTFLGHSGPLFMSVDIPVSGFVSGQKIPIKVSLDNKSGVRVRGVTAVLTQRVTYHIKGGVSRHRLDVAEEKIPLENGFGPETRTLNLLVPPLVPSNMFELSGFIDVKYYLAVRAEVGILRWNLSTKMPIQIGNVPVMTFERPISRERRSPSDGSSPPVQFSQLMRYGDFASPDWNAIEKTVSCFDTGSTIPYPVYSFDTANN